MHIISQFSMISYPDSGSIIQSMIPIPCSPFFSSPLSHRQSNHIRSSGLGGLGEQLPAARSHRCLGRVPRRGHRATWLRLRGRTALSFSTWGLCSNSSERHEPHRDDHEIRRPNRGCSLQFRFRQCSEGVQQ